MKRVGPSMQAAANYVARNPGCSILDVVRSTHPHVVGKNNAVGYNPVHRAIDAGLIRAQRGAGGSYALYPAQ